MTWLFITVGLLILINAFIQNKFINRELESRFGDNSDLYYFNFDFLGGNYKTARPFGNNKSITTLDYALEILVLNKEIDKDRLEELKMSNEYCNSKDLSKYESAIVTMKKAFRKSLTKKEIYILISQFIISPLLFVILGVLLYTKGIDLNSNICILSSFLIFIIAIYSIPTFNNIFSQLSNGNTFFDIFNFIVMFIVNPFVFIYSFKKKQFNDFSEDFFITNTNYLLHLVRTYIIKPIKLKLTRKIHQRMSYFNHMTANQVKMISVIDIQLKLGDKNFKELKDILYSYSLGAMGEQYTSLIDEILEDKVKHMGSYLAYAVLLQNFKDKDMKRKLINYKDDLIFADEKISEQMRSKNNNNKQDNKKYEDKALLDIAKDDVREKFKNLK